MGERPAPLVRNAHALWCWCAMHAYWWVDSCCIALHGGLHVVWSASVLVADAHVVQLPSSQYTQANIWALALWLRQLYQQLLLGGLSPLSVASCSH